MNKPHIPVKDSCIYLSQKKTLRSKSTGFSMPALLYFSGNILFLFATAHLIKREINALAISKEALTKSNT